MNRMSLPSRVSSPLATIRELHARDTVALTEAAVTVTTVDGRITVPASLPEGRAMITEWTDLHARDQGILCGVFPTPYTIWLAGIVTVRAINDEIAEIAMWSSDDEASYRSTAAGVLLVTRQAQDAWGFRLQKINQG